MKKHNYKTKIQWLGNCGSGTSGYTQYQRNHQILIENKKDILASADVCFRGDGDKHNPEDLFLSSISSCFMLWYLHLCSVSGVVVISYVDEATGVMQEDKNGSGKFTEVILNPKILLQNESMIKTATELAKQANQFCFIANSLNFKVKHNLSFQTLHN